MHPRKMQLLQHNLERTFSRTINIYLLLIAREVCHVQHRKTFQIIVGVGLLKEMSHEERSSDLCYI